ncbi:MAG TPA: tRNA cytidylyltransferase [Anaeromyxobacteraceae bacterium]|nr:tRNA cytidylyltransferase [Anaeromyxobacteraceae bacterium]
MPGPHRTLRATDVPAGVRDVLVRLRDAGHRSWVVGGVVRDLLLGRQRHDPDEFDVATPATPAQVQSLFRKVIPTGIDHGTVTVVEGAARVEVTTFRGEGEYEDGRRPSRVTFHDDLEADLARRDFTVNALAWDPLEDDLRDPFGGRQDLRARRIRAVGDARARFAEDGLRPLRAARFVAQLGFRLAPATRAAIPGALPVVSRVSRERVAEELTRLLVGPHAAAGLETLRATGLLAVVLPRLAALPPGRVRHAVAVASAPFPPCRGRAGAADRDGCRVLRLAGLLHVLPAEETRTELQELRMPARVVAEVGALVDGRCPAGEALDALAAADGAGLRRWLAAGGPTRAPQRMALLAADAGHQGARTAVRTAQARRFSARVARELRARPPLEVGDLTLGGRELMALAPGASGRDVGEGLRHLLDVVLADPAANTPDRLRLALQAWWAAHRERAGTPSSGP